MSELETGRETEPMVDTPVDNRCRRGRSGRYDRKVGGAMNGSEGSQVTGASMMRQRAIASAVIVGPIPHGAKLVPKTSERTETEPKNRAVASPSLKRTIEVTDDRDGAGRNPRSSPRTGKPFTWRRGIVGTAGRQEADSCPAR